MTMNIVNLLTPEADRKPPARCAVSSQQSPAESFFVDLTVETTPILSARGFFDSLENCARTPTAHKYPSLSLPYLPRTSDNILLTHTGDIAAEEEIASPSKRKGEF